MSKLPERASLRASDHGAGVRGAIDSLVLGSLVDLFQAYGVAVAPLPRIAAGRAPTIPELSAVIAFTRAGSGSGRLTLSVPAAVLDLTRGGGGSGMRTDWVRELTNQLMGRVKNRLLHFSARVEVGPLNALDSKQVVAHLERSQKTRVYAGRTLRGEVVVTIEGLPEESELVYVGAGNLPAEGDALFF
jgi:hypothetical protein